MLNNLLDPFKKNRCTVIGTQNIKQTQLMASINIKKKYKKPSWFSKALSELYNFTFFILDITYKILNEYLIQSRDIYDFEEREKKYFRKPSCSYLI